jgi:hypothetical protein
MSFSEKKKSRSGPLYHLSHGQREPDGFYHPLANSGPRRFFPRMPLLSPPQIPVLP